MSSDAARHVRLLIIGSGPAGYTAAIYAGRALLSPVLIQGLQPGGQLTITTEIENYPGSWPAPNGPELMQTMADQAKACGTEFVYDIVTDVDFSKRPYAVTCDSGARFTADAVIIATGATAKWLGLPSEEKYSGRGVSACATCDGFFYRGQEVLVVGGGNTAVEEALYLSGLCTKVTVVHRRDEFRAERILIERLKERSNIQVIWDTEIDEILGEDGMTGGVTGARLRDRNDGSLSKVDCDGVFIAIGHTPASNFLQGHVDLDAYGYVQIEPGTTRVTRGGVQLKNVYAAGDICDSVYRQAVTAAGMGCMAALDAQRSLEVA